MGKGYVEICLGHMPVFRFRNGSFLSCIMWKGGVKTRCFFFKKHAEEWEKLKIFEKMGVNFSPYETQKWPYHFNQRLQQQTDFTFEFSILLST